MSEQSYTKDMSNELRSKNLRAEHETNISPYPLTSQVQWHEPINIPRSRKEPEHIDNSHMGKPEREIKEYADQNRHPCRKRIPAGESFSLPRLSGRKIYGSGNCVIIGMTNNQTGSGFAT